MADLNLEILNEGVQNLTEEGYSLQEIERLLQEGMKIVGERFAEGEYFLADLVVSGMMFKAALGPINPDRHFASGEDSKGKVLIGVVDGDIHDIGKDIVVQVLKTEQFDILDLGVDVPAAAFVQAAKNYNPDVIALSGVMCDSVEEMQIAIDALIDAGIHPTIPIVVGGSCVSELIQGQVHANYYAQEAGDTVIFCKEIVGRKINHAQNG